MQKLTAEDNDVARNFITKPINKTKLLTIIIAFIFFIISPANHLMAQNSDFKFGPNGKRIKVPSGTESPLGYRKCRYIFLLAVDGDYSLFRNNNKGNKIGCKKNSLHFRNASRERVLDTIDKSFDSKGFARCLSSFEEKGDEITEVLIELCQKISYGYSDRAYE